MINNEPQGTVLDIGAVTIWIASLANLLPSIAALLSIIWMLLRIWESPTVREWRGLKPYNNGEKDGPAKD